MRSLRHTHSKLCCKRTASVRLDQVVVKVFQYQNTSYKAIYNGRSVDECRYDKISCLCSDDRD